MNRSNIRKEIDDLLMNGKLIFFAGSGISVESGIPSAQQILQATSEVFLPDLPTSTSSTYDDKIQRNFILHFVQHTLPAVLAIIQPEILYERLLEVTHGNPESLGLWKTLSPWILRSFGIDLTPNLNHILITHYSMRHGKPILTTNFDPLFELAARSLHYQYKVIVPTSNFSKAELDSNKLNIIKIHGTIQEDSDSVESMLTTMSDISATNYKFIEYIAETMRTSNLGIVGYSGRDIDLFPHLRQIAEEGCNEIFWISKFGDKEGADYLNALSLSCMSESILRLVEGEYPKQFFSGLRYAEANSLMDYDAPAKRADCRPVIDHLKNTLRRQFEWALERKLLFLGTIFALCGSIQGSIQDSKVPQQ